MTNEAVGKHAPAPFTAEELRILRARHTGARLMEGGDTVMALLNHIDWLAEKFSREENEHAELQSRCFEGFPSVSDGIFDAYKAARNSRAALSARCEKLEALIEELRNDFINIAVGGCTCGTKPPDPDLHDLNCHYRMADTGLGRIETHRALLSGAAK